MLCLSVCKWEDYSSFHSYIRDLWTIDITSDTKTNSWGDRRSGNPCKGTPCINKQNIIRSKQWYINHGCFSGEWKRCGEAPTQPPAIWVRCRHCLCVPCYDLLCAILNKGPLWSSQCSGTAGDQCCLYVCTMVVCSTPPVACVHCIWNMSMCDHDYEVGFDWM